MNFALPSLLTTTNNWGAFLFFAACCFISLVYVFFMVPETAGLSVEDLDALFDGPWFKAYRSTRKNTHILEGTDMEHQKEWVPRPLFPHMKAKAYHRALPRASSRQDKVRKIELDEQGVLPIEQHHIQKVLKY